MARPEGLEPPTPWFEGKQRFEVESVDSQPRLVVVFEGNTPGQLPQPEPAIDIGAD